MIRRRPELPQVAAERAISRAVAPYSEAAARAACGQAAEQLRRRPLAAPRRVTSPRGPSAPPAPRRTTRRSRWSSPSWWPTPCATAAAGGSGCALEADAELLRVEVENRCWTTTPRRRLNELEGVERAGAAPGGRPVAQLGRGAGARRAHPRVGRGAAAREPSPGPSPGRPASPCPRPRPRGRVRAVCRRRPGPRRPASGGPRCSSASPTSSSAATS